MMKLVLGLALFASFATIGAADNVKDLIGGITGGIMKGGGMASGSASNSGFQPPMTMGGATEAAAKCAKAHDMVNDSAAYLKCVADAATGMSSAVTKCGTPSGTAEYAKCVAAASGIDLGSAGNKAMEGSAKCATQFPDVTSKEFMDCVAKVTTGVQQEMVGQMVTGMVTCVDEGKTLAECVGTLAGKLAPGATGPAAEAAAKEASALLKPCEGKRSEELAACLMDKIKKQMDGDHTRPGLPTDCSQCSNPNSECGDCARRCTQCALNAQGSDADGNPCTTCTTCVAFAACSGGLSEGGTTGGDHSGGDKMNFPPPSALCDEKQKSVTLESYCPYLTKENVNMMKSWVKTALSDSNPLKMQEMQKDVAGTLCGLNKLKRCESLKDLGAGGLSSIIKDLQGAALTFAKDGKNVDCSMMNQIAEEMGDMLKDGMDAIIGSAADIAGAIGGAAGAAAGEDVKDLIGGITGAIAGAAGEVKGEMEEGADIASAIMANPKCAAEFEKNLGKMGDMVTGKVLKGLGKDKWAAMDADAIMNMTKKWGDSKDFKPDKDIAETILGKVKEAAGGNLAGIDERTIKDMTNVIGFMDPADFKDIDPAAIAEMGMNGLKNLKKDQVKAMAGNLKELADGQFGDFLDGLDDAEFDPADLKDEMDAFTETQKAAVVSKIKKAKGGFDKFTKDTLTNLGENGMDTLFKGMKAEDWTTMADDALTFDTLASAADLDTMKDMAEDTVKAIGAKMDKLLQAEGDLSAWDDAKLKKIGGAAAGLAKATLDKFDDDKLKKLLKEQQMINPKAIKGSDLLGKAKEIYSDASKFDEDAFDTLGDAIADVIDNVEDIRKIPEGVIQKKLKTFANAAWTAAEESGVLEMCKKAIGDVTKATKEVGQNLGKMIGKFDKDTLKDFPKDALDGALDAAESFIEDLSEEQQDALAERYQSAFDAATDMTADFIKKCGAFSGKALKGKIKDIKADAIDGAIDTLKEVEFAAEESADIFSKFFDNVKAKGGAAAKLAKDDVKKVGKFLAAAEDDVLVALADDDMPNVDPEVLDIIEPAKLKKAFPAKKIKKLTAKARKEIKGATLKALDNEQVRATICASNPTECPGAVADQTWKYDPKKQTQESILKQIKDKLAAEKINVAVKIHTFKVKKAKKGDASKSTRLRRLSATGTATDSLTLRSETSTKADADKVAGAAGGATVDGATVETAAVAVTDTEQTVAKKPASGGDDMKPDDKKGVVAAGSSTVPSVLAAVVVALAGKAMM